METKQNRLSRIRLIALLLPLLSILVPMVLLAWLSIAKAPEPAFGQDNRVELKSEVFLRPGTVRRGGTYDLYLDVKDGTFNANTIIESGSLNVVALHTEVRHGTGLTMTVAISVLQAPGLVPIVIRTPQADGKEERIELSLRVLASDEVGPAITFTNLPAGERIVTEGGFAHLEVALEGDGPFHVEYGLRHKSFWSSMKWNVLLRNYAEEQGYVMEGPEEESFDVALPEQLNTVDVVVIDRNGLESYQSLVIESLAPIDLENFKEVGFLDKILGKKVACADCSATDPSFTFYSGSCVGSGQCLDTDGRSPLLLSAAACQGTECRTCSSCDQSECLTTVSGGPAAGGYDRPDGYSPPTEMFRNHGVVYPHSGEYRYTVTDMSVPVPGLEFAITRTYRSQIEYHSRLGRNWDMNIFARYLRYGSFTGTMNVANGNMHYFGGDGRRDTYTYSGGSFTSPDGFFDKFVFNPSSFSQEIRHKDGRRFVFSESQVGPNVVRGRLSTIYARIGTNSLAFSYDVNGYLTTITSSTGIDLRLQYTSNYLSRIYQDEDTYHEVLYTNTSGTGYDGILEKVEYGTTTFYDYDGINGADNLSPYITRKKLIYEYDTAGTGDQKYNLKKIFDGRGNTGTEKTYAALSLTYYQSADPDPDCVKYFKTDPDTTGTGWVGSQLYFTEYGMSGSDRLTRYEVSGYDSQATPVNQVLRKFELTFDPVKGGVKTKTIKTSSGSTVATWTYERDCTCNRPTKITDPLGRVERRTYDAYGNLTERVLEGATGTTDDIVMWYKYDSPYFINSAKFGGLLESADAETVAPYYILGQTIDHISAAEKTRYTYATNGNLTTFTPPAFYHASEFGDAASHQPEIGYGYNTDGQVATKEVKLDSSVLRKVQTNYYTTGTTKSLIQDIIVDPDTGGMQLKTTYDYNARRDLISIKDPKGQTSGYVTNFDYPTSSGDRLVLRVRPPNSTSDEEIKYRYDGNNKIVGMDVGGNATGQRIATFINYDKTNQRVKVRTEVPGDTDYLTATNTVEVSYSYDAEGRMRKMIEPGSKVSRSQFAFLLDGSIYYWQKKDFVSGTGVTEYQTKEARWKKTVDRTLSTALIDATTSQDTVYVYDAFGRREFQVRNPSSTVYYGSLTTFNRNGNVTRREEGEQTSQGDHFDKTLYTFRTVEYRDHDEIDRIIRTESYQVYTRLGSSSTPSAESDPITYLTKHSYDGRITTRRKVLPSGNADTTYTYDNASRIKVTTFPDGQSQSETDYDSNGNVTKIHSKDYNPDETPTVKDFIAVMLYDDRNRRTEEVVEGYNNASRAANYQRHTFGYDYRGNLSARNWDIQNSTTDVITKYGYDGLNRLKKTTYDGAVGGINLVNEIIYDDANRTITRRDGDTQDTVYTYRKELDVVRKIQYAAGGSDNEYFDCNRRGLVTKHTRASSVDPPTAWDITYTRDLLGRVTSRALNSAVGSGEETVADYTYDYQDRLLTGKSKLEGSSSYKSEITRTYNALFLTQEDQKKFDATPVFTIRTTGGTGTGYDLGGRRTRLEYENNVSLSTSRVLTVGYDSSDRLASIAEGAGLFASYAYAGPNLRVRKATLYDYGTINSKLEKKFSYDHLRRPTLVDYRIPGGASIVSYAEGWGNDTVNTTYTPDRYFGVFNRTSFQRSGGTTIQYGYDALGCLVSVDSEARSYDNALNRLSAGSYSFSYVNDSNQLTSFSYPSSVTVQVAHDARGNLTEKNRSSGNDNIYKYDRLNRLVEYGETVLPTPPSTVWKYNYDAFGRRTKKWTTGEARYYFYDGERVVLELIDAGSSSVKEYIYGNGIDEVLVERLPDGGSTQTFWPCVDSLGTVRDLADLNGGTARVRMAYNLNVDGKLVSETSASGTTAVYQDVLFTGRWLDRESGLYSYRARQYDPEIARFPQRDRILDIANLGNLYPYVANDPINSIDPSGDECNQPDLAGPQVEGGPCCCDCKQRYEVAYGGDISKCILFNASIVRLGAVVAGGGGGLAAGGAQVAKFFGAKGVAGALGAAAGIGAGVGAVLLFVDLGLATAHCYEYVCTDSSGVWEKTTTTEVQEVGSGEELEDGEHAEACEDACCGGRCGNTVPPINGFPGGRYDQTYENVTVETWECNCEGN